MKQVFLIQAHHDLSQLNALIEQLCDDDFLTYVNLDRKSAIDPAAIDARAHLVARRIDVHWGGFSQVQATLHALAQILDEAPPFDKVLFLSGQDYPLLSNAALKRALARLRACELLDSVAIGTGPGEWAAAFRYQYFHCSDARGPLPRLCRLLNAGMRATGLRRRLPRGLAPYGGSSWWALSRACARHVLERAHREPDTVRFFRSVACPDELFFQTLVMDSPFRARVLGRNLRYVQWPQGGARNPKVLDEGDFERIAAARRFEAAQFCRKIDSRASAGLVARLQALRAP